MHDISYIENKTQMLLVRQHHQTFWKKGGRELLFLINLTE